MHLFDSSGLTRLLLLVLAGRRSGSPRTCSQSRRARTSSCATGPPHAAPLLGDACWSDAGVTATAWQQRRTRQQSPIPRSFACWVDRFPLPGLLPVPAMSVTHRSNRRAHLRACVACTYERGSLVDLRGSTRRRDEQQLVRPPLSRDAREKTEARGLHAVRSGEVPNMRKKSCTQVWRQGPSQVGLEPSSSPCVTLTLGWHGTDALCDCTAEADALCDCTAERGTHF